DPTWGVVATIRASCKEILEFAGHYLGLGAQRVFIYLDEDEPTARSALKRHPNCRVIVTDDGYWKRRRKKRGRPDGHQFRQSVNATHCYNRSPGVDWLLHADVDEFLVSTAPIAEHLATVPPTALSARVRPIEALQSDETDPPPEGYQWCKSFDPRQKVRRAQTAKIYPNFGLHLNGGFISHVAGKVFVRTGQEEVSLRIHNAFQGGVKEASPAELPGCQLVHLHAASWEEWWQRYRYRLTHGSYRPDLKAAAAYCTAAMTMHELLSQIEKEGGEEALRAFYDEVCVATPALRQRLKRQGHLHDVRLDLAQKRRKHFGEEA
ncbi:MAG: glycosyltransferase family 2 protein, partial [Pseudomonadota bacterium]